MQNSSIQLADVIYNPAEQTFEALVTVNRDGVTRTYPCAINAPITMTFEQAAQGLRKQAERRDAKGGGMYSEQVLRAAKQRAGRPRFDPRRWLESLVALPGNRAA
ncbi:orotidine 5-phosphate decarboxylase [Sulfitobacter alexandrii]|uniref:Orotidine 5-phosphate decarboxylase n=2 Tax=Sulfitobacter alexandrii TaxID=1917485 RepID=A0A1J0WMQ5_9RHOB|nr:orotidine 5-phosphate decarboxylase [Sulfitobacter alexandrii]